MIFAPAIGLSIGLLVLYSIVFQSWSHSIALALAQTLDSNIHLNGDKNVIEQRQVNISTSNLNQKSDLSQLHSPHTIEQCIHNVRDGSITHETEIHQNLEAAHEVDVFERLGQQCPLELEQWSELGRQCQQSMDNFVDQSTSSTGIIILGQPQNSPYVVVIPGDNFEQLSQVQIIVPNAFITRSRRGRYIHAASFPKRLPAEALSSQLRYLGFDAQVTYLRNRSNR